MLSELKTAIRRHGFRHVVSLIDNMYGLGRLERIIAMNWFNPLVTLWVNVRSFPISQALRFPIFVFGRPYIRSLSGQMRVEGRVYPGMITFNQTRSGSPNLQTIQSEILNRGLIVFKGPGIIGTGNRIFTQPGAVLELGAHFKIADQVNLDCMKRIVFGDLVRVTHRCQVIDSNYHYVANFNGKITPPILTI